MIIKTEAYVWYMSIFYKLSIQYIPSTNLFVKLNHLQNKYFLLPSFSTYYEYVYGEYGTFFRSLQNAGVDIIKD